MPKRLKNGEVGEFWKGKKCFMEDYKQIFGKERYKKGMNKIP